jgi:hypothetical protein
MTVPVSRTGGLPHSEILGSTPARGSPRLFAACHVLHRLLAPRHPPDALLILDPPAGTAPHQVCDLAGTPPAGARHLQEGTPWRDQSNNTHYYKLLDRPAVEHDGTMRIPMPNSPLPKRRKDQKEGKGPRTCQRPPTHERAPWPEDQRLLLPADGPLITTTRCAKNSHPFPPRTKRARQGPSGGPKAKRGGTKGSLEQTRPAWGHAQDHERPLEPQGEAAGLVGLGRLERPTSRLSGVRSNQLSYRPEGIRRSEVRGPRSEVRR